MSITQKLMMASGKKGFDPTTPIGTAVEGGFFAGIIVQGGDEYAIIVAPKASGESGSQTFKTSNTASPAATQTLNNGPAATAAMVAAGGHPAANFCDGRNIGGFFDWYLPARDELELLYRNLKPTASGSDTGNRVESAITYPEGDDEPSDENGLNRNSSPTGAAYTSVNPAQTSVAAFQTGGSEAFADLFYWSSSEFSDSTAWRQAFSGGGQGNGTKNFPVYVRAVRRVAI
jgi:hypothetical protein